MNEKLASQGKPAVKVALAPEELEDEDLLEMAKAGLVDTLIVDNHKAWFWQRVWPSLLVYPDRRFGAVPFDGCDVPQVWCAVQPGLDDDGGAGFPGIATRSERPQPGGRNRREIHPLHVDQMLFTFAAYNAGPGRVRQLRREAETAAVEGSMKFFAKRQAVCYS
ncbi:MAG TPA: hypothetical protein VGH34_15465 [Vicinamibacterales bacterium]